MKKINIIGQKFGKLLVLKQIRPSVYLCKCDCSNKIELPKSSFVKSSDKYRVRKSCGCLAKEKNKTGATKVNPKSKNPVYKRWWNMLDRCYNASSSNYKYYGNRGIRVCNHWFDFKNFYEDMGDIPFKGATIDRVDNNGSYELKNCRWATPEQQANNKSNNITLKYKGKNHSFKELSQTSGVNEKLLRARISKGWSTRKAISKPSQRNRYSYIEYEGKVYNISELAEKVKMKKSLLSCRISRGWPIEEAITILSGNKKTKDKSKTIKFKNKSHTINEWSKITGVRNKTLKDRLKNGWSIEKTLTTPIFKNVKKKFKTKSYRFKIKIEKYIVKSYELKNEIINYKKKPFTSYAFTLCEWAKITGINVNVLQSRINRGWSVERFLTTPVNNLKAIIIKFKGQSHTLREWSEVTGMPLGSLRGRYKAGWSAEKMLTTPVDNFIDSSWYKLINNMR